MRNKCNTVPQSPKEVKGRNQLSFFESYNYLDTNHLWHSFSIFRSLLYAVANSRDGRHCSPKCFSVISYKSFVNYFAITM